MHTRAFAVLLCMLICALLQPVCAEGSLRTATTLEEAALYIDFTADDGSTPEWQPAVPGRVRHIPQMKSSPEFLADYWIAGDTDLTAKKAPNGHVYSYYCGNMCTRAVYCEVLSYFGIDLSPADLSERMHTRNLDCPYDDVTATIDGLTRAYGGGYNELPQMIENYLTDSSYSPVMITVLYESGKQHSLLIVGVMEDGTLIVLDTGYHQLNGRTCYLTTVRLAQNYRYIKKSQLSCYQGLYIRSAYQWHWEGGSAGEAETDSVLTPLGD